MSPLLRIDDLHVQFDVHGHRVQAVRGANLAVARGEVLALVGESGSGKSVTAAAILGLLPARTARVTGSIKLGGVELTGLDDHALNEVRGSQVGMIFQNPATSFDPSFTIGSQLLETARLHLQLDREQATAVATGWLERVGITDPARVLRAYPHELSGGMRQRAMIALASLAEPSLLVADEPTTALDTTVQKQVLDLLLSATRQSGAGLLLITHDFGVVAHTSDQVAVMKDGVIVETGRTDEVLGDPRHDYTRTLIGAVPSLGRRRAVGSGPRRLATATEHRAVAGPSLPLAEAPTAPPLLELLDVHKEFTVGGLGTGIPRSSFDAVDRVSLQVARGEVVGLIGQSGSGKSTLARLAGHLLPLTSGLVRFDGVDLAHQSRDQRSDLRRRFQYVFQDASTALNPRVQIGDQIARPLRRLRTSTSRRDAARATLRALDLVGLGAAHVDRYPHELSGGQRQRVSIARAIALEPDLLVLDEPTSALDVSTQARVLDLLLDLKDHLGLTYLFIGHDLAVIELVCDRIGVLDRGRLVETFDADDLLDHSRHPSTRLLVDAVLPVTAPRPAPLAEPAL